MPQKLPYISQILSELVEEIGATLWLEPELGQAGIITFRNGRTYIYKNGGLNINLAGSIHISRNKGYSHMFLEHFGYSVAAGRTFFSDVLADTYGARYSLSEAISYAQELGYPVIVKPNNLSQGKGIRKVVDERELRDAISEVLALTDVYRIESYFCGDDYRIVVLDGEIVSAYQRIPLAVRGDGIHTVDALLREKVESLSHLGREIRLSLDDPRIPMKLREYGYTLESIPVSGEEVSLLDNANLSTGGTSRDVTDIIHPDYRDLAIAVTRDMGLRLCGVDIMTRGSIDAPIEEKGDTVIIEVNGAPGLDHYVSMGEIQRTRAKAMYKKILLAIESSLT